MYTLRACRQFAYRGAIPDVAMPVARVRHAGIVASGMDGDGRSSVGYMRIVPIVWGWGTW